MAIDKSVVNMHINFYYGNLISLSDKWHGYNVRCAYSKIYYFVSGECEIVIKGTTYRAKAGDMFLIPKGTLHSFYHVNNNYVKKYWFHFEFDCGGENFFDSLDFPYVITPENTEYVTELMEKILQPYDENSVSSTLRLKSSIIELVAYYIEKSGAKSKTDYKADITKLFRYIDENLKNSFTVAELAEKLHMHPNYFIKYFKQKTGFTPMKYLNNRRMEYAKNCLLETDMPVLEIMKNLGLSDTSHFSKMFKNYSGYSPKQFRAKFKKHNT